MDDADPPAAEQERAAPGATAAPAAAATRRRGPRLPVLFAVLLSVPIVMLTFTKEPAPEDPVTMGDLRKHFGWRGAVLSLADSLERQFPQDFAGSALGTDEEHSGWVGFRDGVPPGAQALIAMFRADPRNGTIDVLDHLGFTAAELRARADAARAALARLDGLERADVRLEERTGVLELDLTRAGDAPVTDEGFRNEVLTAVDAELAQRVELWVDGAKATDEVQPVRFGPAPPASPAPSATP